ncbi:MAG TPA: hypothetical protein VF307_04880 [Candidatus Nanopelagicaceae bacterium]
MKTRPINQSSRKWMALMCLPLAFLLTGCIKLDMALTVNEDKSMSGTVIVAIADSLDALGTSSGSSGATGTNDLNNLIDKNSKGVTVSKYHQGGFTGEKYTMDHAPLSAFSSTASKDGSFAINIKGNQATVSGVFDLSMTDAQSADASSLFGAAFAKTLFSTAEIRIAVTFPGKVIKSTGVISPDGRTVTWKPVFGEKTNLSATVALDTPTKFIPWAIGGVLLLALIIGLIILNRKKKSVPDAANDLEAPPAADEIPEEHSI